MKTATSSITSKFQTTIPKAVRDNLKLAVSDTIAWDMENGRIVVRAAKNNFMSHKNAIKAGPGNARDDIELARKMKMEKYR